jgi:hypothetical protein
LAAVTAVAEETANPTAAFWVAKLMAVPVETLTDVVGLGVQPATAAVRVMLDPGFAAVEFGFENQILRDEVAFRIVVEVISEPGVQAELG